MPHRQPSSTPQYTSRRHGWYVAAAACALVVGSVVGVDHLQRQPTGPVLQPDAAPWVWDNAAFGIKVSSLRLVPEASNTLLTGSFSRQHGAANNSLPPGALLETQLPHWKDQSMERLLLKLPQLGGSSMQGRLLQEAMRDALRAGMESHDPQDAQDAQEAALALQWLAFQDRQFLAQLGENKQLHIAASLGQQPLHVRNAGTESGLLLGSGAKGTQLWSQPAFVSRDSGASWEISDQQLPSSIDRQGWVSPRIGFIWHQLESALLVTHDGGLTWKQPTIASPLTMAPRPKPESNEEPAFIQEWRNSLKLQSLHPYVWGDTLHDPALDERHETLLTANGQGQVMGWSTRWTRTVQNTESGSKTFGPWQPAMTRQFLLQIDDPLMVRITDLQEAVDAPAIDNAPSDIWLHAADGSITLQRDEQLYHLDASNWQWQRPAALPQPVLQRPFSRSNVWVGNHVWVTHAEGPALLDIAACLLPSEMKWSKRCDKAGANAYYVSRDLGQSWQPFRLPDPSNSHIVGWDESAKKLLVARTASSDAEHTQVSFAHYSLPSN